MTVGQMTVRQAREDEFETVLALLSESIRWLRSRGSDQWSTWRTWRTKMWPALQRGDVWLLLDGDDPIGTITVERQGEADFWTVAELAEASGYVSKLTIRRDYAGRELGAVLLEWAADLMWRQGADWLRLDAWKTNPGLQDYYARRGWTHLRTSSNPRRRSGALFQIPTKPMSASTAQLVRQVPPLPTLRTAWRGAVADDNPAGNWQPDHTHAGGLTVDYRHAGPLRAQFVDFLRYRVREAGGKWVLEAQQRPYGWECHGAILDASWPLVAGATYYLTHQDSDPCQMVIWHEGG